MRFDNSIASCWSTMVWKNNEIWLNIFFFSLSPTLTHTRFILYRVRNARKYNPTKTNIQNKPTTTNAASVWLINTYNTQQFFPLLLHTHFFTLFGLVFIWFSIHLYFFLLFFSLYHRMAVAEVEARDEEKNVFCVFLTTKNVYKRFHDCDPFQFNFR